MFNKKAQPPIRSLIAHGTRVEGGIAFADGLRIDGEVAGDVRGRGESDGGFSGAGGTGKAPRPQPSLLVISELAIVTGAVEADHVIVNGTVRGPVTARRLLELQPKARIEGDVTYEALEMHQGAVIAGQLRPATPFPSTLPAAAEKLALPPAADEKPLLKLAATGH